MKIRTDLEDRVELVGNIPHGSVIEFDGEYHLVTSEHDELYVTLVNLENGSIDRCSNEVGVVLHDKAELILHDLS